MQIWLLVWIDKCNLPNLPNCIITWLINLLNVSFFTCCYWVFTKIECVLSNSNKIAQARQTNSVTNSQEELLCCIFASEVLTNSSRIWHSLHHLIQLHSWLEAAELELFMSYCCRKLCKPSHWVVVIAWIAIWSPALGEALAIVTIKMQKSWVLSFCNQTCPHSSIWCPLQKASHLTMVCNDASSTIYKLGNSFFLAIKLLSMHAQLPVWSCCNPRSCLQKYRWCSRSASSAWPQTSLHVLLTMRRDSCSSNQTGQHCHCTEYLQSHQSNPALVHPWGLALTKYMSRKTLLLFWFEPALWTCLAFAAAASAVVHHVQVLQFSCSLHCAFQTA